MLCAYIYTCACILHANVYMYVHIIFTTRPWRCLLGFGGLYRVFFSVSSSMVHTCCWSLNEAVYHDVALMSALRSVVVFIYCFSFQLFVFCVFMCFLLIYLFIVGKKSAMTYVSLLLCHRLEINIIVLYCIVTLTFKSES